MRMWCGRYEELRSRLWLAAAAELLKSMCIMGVMGWKVKVHMVLQKGSLMIERRLQVQFCVLNQHVLTIRCALLLLLLLCFITDAMAVRLRPPPTPTPPTVLVLLGCMRSCPSLLRARKAPPPAAAAAAAAKTLVWP